MEPRFRKRADLSIVVLPGIGNIRQRVLTGEQYRRYCPMYLEELPPSPPVVSQRPAELVPIVVEVPEPVELVELPEPKEELPEPTSFPRMTVEYPPGNPSMRWTKPELQAYAKERGVVVGERTKAQIIQAIEEVTDELS